MNGETPGLQVDIQIEMSAGLSDDALEALLLRALRAAAEVLGPAAAGEMSLVLTDDAHMRELNRTYRDVDSSTDVLSFAAMEEDAAGSLVVPVDMPAYLGDVIISVARAQAQANDGRHAVEAELSLLAVHGLLHLLGYDHADAQDKAGMWAIQEAVLNGLGYVDVKPTDE